MFERSTNIKKVLKINQNSGNSRLFNSSEINTADIS